VQLAGMRSRFIVEAARGILFGPGQRLEDGGHVGSRALRFRHRSDTGEQRRGGP